MKWRIGAVVVLLGLVAGIATLICTAPKKNAGAVQPGSPDNRSIPDHVTFGGSDDPGTLDAQAIDWGEQARIAQSVFETLVRFKHGSSDIEPGLATEWKISENGTVWDFALRQGIRFHDGTPLDANAVVFTFERFKADNPFAPKTIPYASNYSIIVKVEALDPTHVRFKLSAPSAVFLKTLAMFSGGIVSPAAVKKGVDAFAQNPVGTGPYKLKEWQKDVRVVLEAFDKYWGPKPKIPKVIVLPVKDAGSRVERLCNGEIDIMDNISPADVQSLSKHPDVKLDFETSLNVCYLGFNGKRAPYNDVNFRKAIACALDKPTLIKLAYFGAAEPAKSILPPAIPGHDPKVFQYPLDIQKAKEYLAKVPNLPAEVELWHMSYSRPYVPDPEKVALAIKDDLQKIGLKVKLSSFDRASYGVQIKSEKHPMILLGWSADYVDADNFLFALLNGESIANDGNNCTFFDHAEFNRLTRQAQTELDEAKRMELYKQAQKIYIEELPSIPLVHVKQVVAFKKTLSYKIHPVDTRLYEIDIAK